jgi:uncharacterized protein (TIGR02453 family)
MRFAGFPDPEARFFRLLAKHQNREWFQAHKREFEDGWLAPMKLLLDEVRDAIDTGYRYCDLGAPKIFRIYRDVRFSRDKSPYKTHVGGLVPIKRMGKLTEVPAALYFHVGQPRSFAAAGHYVMDTRALGRFREAVADEQRGKDLVRLLSALRKKGFSIDSFSNTKRVPKGYPPDHPRAEHLRRKGLVVGFPPLPTGLLASPKLVPWLAKQARSAARLVEWLVFATF